MSLAMIHPANPLISGTNAMEIEEGSELHIDIQGHAVHEEVYTALRKRNWAKVQELMLNEHTHWPHDIILTEFGKTVLHVAVGTTENIKVLENLLKWIDPLSIRKMVNNEGHNPLHYAAIIGNTKAVDKLVKKQQDLLFIVDKSGRLPIELAIYNSHKDAFSYLLDECKKSISLSKTDGYRNPFERQLILEYAISAGLIDVAYQLLKDYPQLAEKEKNTSKSFLYGLEKQQDAYSSDTDYKYNHFQRFIYSQLPVESYNLDDTYKIQDTENKETYICTGVTFVCNVIRRICATFWKVALLVHVPHIKRLHNDKQKHTKALAILKFICEKTSKLNFDHFPHHDDALFIAVQCDIPEVVEQITQWFPDSIWARNKKGRSLFQFSILNRSEKVFKFLVEKVGHERYLHTEIVDNKGNNILHLSGTMAPPEKLNMVSGAALQMQRELEWFKAVKKLLHRRQIEAKNKSNQTPRMVFEKQHQDLRQKGEDWMKKTAESYTITAALIITIVFAAAITVPGGNDSTGRANYRTKTSFIMFIISDAVSLFTSTTSLLYFLSILTARYTEDDFLRRVPRRLISGAMMLFISVTSMMMAFSTTLYIMSGRDHAWIVILIVVTCLPIALFLILQLPAIAAIFSSTYGHTRIFKEQNNELMKTS